MAVILPARAQRVTVFGLTRNSAATSAGVRSASLFGWSAIWIFILLNYLLTVLVIIPLLAFNLAGGSFWPVRITLQSVAFGMMVAGLGAAACVYLYFEFRRIARREADEAARLGGQLARR